MSDYNYCIWSHIWTTIYYCPYILIYGDHICVYRIWWPYMLDHICVYRIWLLIYEWPYMRIWLTIYDGYDSHMSSHIWLSVYDHIRWAYMSDRIWLTIYDELKIDRIWLTVYDLIYEQSYMTVRIWSYTVTINTYGIWWPYMCNHICVYRIWLLIYEWPYMIDHIWWITVYDLICVTIYGCRIWLPHMIYRIWLIPYMMIRKTVYECVYDWPYMIADIWSYTWFIYERVHIWTSSQIIYGRPMRCR